MFLSAINQMDRAAFVEAVGWVFEGSPWVAERAWATRPWASVEGLHQAMCQMVEMAPIALKLDLIRAHPDLGSRARMAEASAREQKGAGLDTLAPEEFDRLQRLNRSYREKFGFPFILAVRGKTKGEVLQALEERLEHDKQTELEAALEQIYRIAWWRLSEVVNP
ncbi:2-oxo-4-hydroxy-4-carboxy-5-ureidoimidazoline decarboxylase [Meiothermus sp. PNK-Is4]|nr:2-oxo-4-hydroxy-4-carboxy-5-ureidoimidazoline decarboxylase [Meiothermus sp. Pnk-1]RYM37120.1 2-oxo-4-hydroxy-4-carboxy-5-ureidoimidazoline decarboxylase [Meiothermus sp. PNK-Is4]